MTNTGFAFARMAAQATIGPVLEVGSRPAATQEHLCLRPLFDGRAYLGVDLQEGPNVDLVGDGAHVHELLAGRRFGLGLCLDTLEHCRHPEQVIASMSRLCDTLILRAPFCFPLHEHPADYWRFSPALFAIILRDLYPCGFSGQDSPGASWPGYAGDLLPQHAYGFASKDALVAAVVVERFQAYTQFTVVEEW